MGGMLVSDTLVPAFWSWHAAAQRRCEQRCKNKTHQSVRYKVSTACQTLYLMNLSSFRVFTLCSFMKLQLFSFYFRFFYIFIFRVVSIHFQTAFAFFFFNFSWFTLFSGRIRINMDERWEFVHDWHKVKLPAAKKLLFCLVFYAQSIHFLDKLNELARHLPLCCPALVCSSACTITRRRVRIHPLMPGSRAQPSLTQTTTWNIPFG